MKSVCLMYHDVGARDSRVPRSASMYHVTTHTFSNHLSAIRDAGGRVLTIAESLGGGGDNSVVITFDDGWKGAFGTAMPLVQAAGWAATFFVTRDFVGRAGFADRHMIQDAAAAGMEIGVHGTTHRMLSGCSYEETTHEFAACKAYLEAIIGKPIVSASVPGGDVNETIASCARAAGLTILCTSRPGINNAMTPALSLRRIAIRSTTGRAEIERYCRYDVGREVTRWTAFELPRSVLGMKNYSRLRRWILRESNGRRAELFNP